MGKKEKKPVKVGKVCKHCGRTVPPQKHKVTCPSWWG